MSKTKLHNLVVSNLTQAQVNKVLDALYDISISADLAEKCDNCGGQFALVFMEDVDFAHYGHQRFCCHCAGHYYDSLPEPPLVSSKESPILEYEKRISVSNMDPTDIGGSMKSSDLSAPIWTKYNVCLDEQNGEPSAVFAVELSIKKEGEK
tara:strand:+ start:3586 stop:4038 length:453 start_codon:yes stop_codon:yes gene_type:complete